MKQIPSLLLAAVLMAAIPNERGTIETIEKKIKALKRVDYQVFSKGEELEYVVHYGFVYAGKATIEVVGSKKNNKGQELTHVKGTGFSTGAFDWFFKVRDTYESYINAESMNPELFVRRVDEGGYKINQDYKFNHEQNVVVNQSKEKYEIPEGIQDMMSAFYYARTIDFTNVKKGDVFTMYAFVDNEIEPLGIKFYGRRTIETEAGEFKCLAFQPRVLKGKVFKEEDDLLVYVTDDKNRIPVMVEAKILVGSVKMELESYKGLTHDVALVKN